MSEEIKELPQEEKAVLTAEIVGPGVPFGVNSFADLEAMQQAKASAQTVEMLSEQFGMIAKNIMANPEIEDKAAGISTLAGEFAERVGQAMEVKEKWQPLTDKAVTKLDELKQKPMKTEGGVKFPASDFAFVPDPQKPSTWKLRLAEGSPGNVTVKQLGRAAAAFSSGGFRGQRVQIPSDKVAGVKAKIRAAYKKLGTKPGDIPDSIKERTFTTWKEKDGSTKWLAVYSNNYRDNDNPPEIIAAQAHKDFIKAVDDGEWPKPVLRYWHVPGADFGTTEMLAYDDNTGMMMAAGTIDKGKEHILENIASEPHLVSHGMPSHTIERNDPGDPTIITAYRSKEIGPLPAQVAANKITAFETLKESEDMKGIEKKFEQLEKMGFDTEEIKVKLEEAKAQAETEGRESKEKDVEDTAPVEPVEAPVEPQPESLTVEMIAEAFSGAIKPVMERLEAVEGQIKEMGTSEEEVEEKEEAPDLTPAASLFGALQSVIGNDAALVDGRKARHDAPKETKAATAGGPILNSKNPLANDVINTILDPDGAWLDELPGVQRRQ